MSDVSFSVSDTIDPALKEDINAELRRFNREKNPVWYAVRDSPEGESRALNVVAFDASKNAIGGLFGETVLAWLKISIVSVRSDSRRRGLGTQLMALAEEEAVRRGCRYSFLDTMDYQAPDFYEKLGYSICGRLEDWDSHGHAKLFMKKNLRQGMPPTGNSTEA